MPARSAMRSTARGCGRPCGSAPAAPSRHARRCKPSRPRTSGRAACSRPDPIHDVAWGRVMHDHVSPEEHISLEEYLDTWAATDRLRSAAATSISALAAACRDIAAIVRTGPLAGNLAARCSDRAGGDVQTQLDVAANDLLAKAMTGAPVAAIVS